MTIARMQLDPMDESHAHHVRRAHRLIDTRLSDARAHAGRGDLVTATQRLADLQVALLTPDGQGMIGDAFARFYSDVWRHDPFDPDIHDPALMHPVAEGAQAARTAPIMGRDASLELAAHVRQAKQALMTAAWTTGRDDPAARAATLDTWHAQHSASLRAWATGTLSNAQIGLHNAVGYLRLKKEFRDGEQHPLGP